jgi:diguanylate cyclase (GGDEF)-like protein/PAS domain S-box-containing protein
MKSEQRPPSGAINILVVEDSASDAEFELRELKRAGLDVSARVVDTEPAFRSALRKSTPDLIIADFSMPEFSGLRALEIAREEAGFVPFIFVSGTLGEDTAVDAVKRGATDYVLKDNLRRLVPAVTRALQEAAERRAREEAESRLRRTERMLDLFLRHLPGGAFIKDLAGRYLIVNHGIEQALNRPREQILGRSALELHPESIGRELLGHDLEIIKGGRDAQTTEVLRQPDGDHTYLVHKFPIRDEHGELTALGGVALDITDRIRQERKLARLLRVRELSGEVNAAIARTRDRGNLLAEICRIAVEVGGMKQAWAALFDEGGAGLTPVAAHGSDGVQALLDASAAEKSGLARLAASRREVVLDNDIANSTLDPAWKARCLEHNLLSGIALPLSSRRRMVSILSLYSAERDSFDADELRLFNDLAADASLALENIEHREQLDYLAYFDALTGLANRALFLDRLERLIDEARRTRGRVALAYLDVERMRLINESLGRSAGDALLREIASRLRKEYGDTLIARIAMDGFAVSVPGLASAVEAGLVVSAGLGAVFAAEFEPGGRKLAVTAKYGVAMFPDDGDQADKLLQNAEKALRSAKSRDETMAFYTPRLEADVAQRLAMETRLRRALERGEFVLHYQPKVSLDTGLVEGLEALLRWNDSIEGLTAPVKFIPLLEETGLILEVGRWTLREAAAAHARWQAAGLKAPRIAVNISPVQLRDEGFATDVMAAAVRRDACPIDLEITESMVIHDLDRSVRILSEPRSNGVRIAVDDFGTGYSSLSYLARLPVDHLKIDRSFVNGLNSNPGHATIVSSIITLAHSLRLNVIAEGVETREQFRQLRQLQCDQAQGYLISPPVPEARIGAMLGG